MDSRLQVAGGVRAILLLGLMSILPAFGCAWRHASLEARIEGVTDGFFSGPLPEQMKVNHVPGVSIVVIDRDRIEWARGFGLTSAADGCRVDKMTMFQASSISKAVTAAVALKLVKEGVLKLDENVNDELTSWKVPGNEFTEQSPVTLRELLSHTSCLNRPEGGFGYKGRYPTTVEVLDGTLPAINPPAEVECVPGTEVRYSNFGYIVIQQLIEDATSRRFADLARDMVLQPAGMASSTFQQPLSGRLLEQAALPHDLEGEVMERTFSPNAVAQGGLWTTPSDLARLLIEVMKASDGEATSAVSPELAAQMLKPCYSQLENGRFMGMGFLVLGDWAILQAGSDPGFRSLLAGFPKTGQGVVVMVNGDGGELLQLRLVLNFVAEYLLKPVMGWLAVGGICLVLILSSFLIWPVGFLVRRIRRRNVGAVAGPQVGSLCRRGRLVALLAAIVLLGAIYPYLVYSLSTPGSPGPMGGSVAALIVVILLLCSMALSLLLSVVVYQAWKRRLFALPARIYFTAVSAAIFVSSILWLDIVGLF